MSGGAGTCTNNLQRPNEPEPFGTLNVSKNRNSAKSQRTQNSVPYWKFNKAGTTRIVPLCSLFPYHLTYEQ